MGIELDSTNSRGDEDVVIECGHDIKRALVLVVTEWMLRAVLELDPARNCLAYYQTRMLHAARGVPAGTCGAASRVGDAAPWTETITVCLT
jgi:hypothetical protein